MKRHCRRRRSQTHYTKFDPTKPRINEQNEKGEKEEEKKIQ